MRTKVVIALLLACGMVLSTLSVAQDKPTGTLLSEADLQSLFTGGALLDTLHERTGRKGSLALMASGLAFVHWLNASGGTGGGDVGGWRIVGDTLCFKWKTLGSGEEFCSWQYKVRDNTYRSWRVPDGRYRWSYSLRL